MAAQTAVAAWLAKLGDEVQDVDQETFDLFSQALPSQDLGMVDARTEKLEITVCGRDFEIMQSPGVLQSSRAGGTTGAAVWRSSVAFTEWMGSPKNPLFAADLLNTSSTVLELGAGVSGILPCLLSTKVRKVLATDQSYILKLLRDNIEANTASSLTHRKADRKRQHRARQPSAGSIDVLSLDWENDDVPSVLSANGIAFGCEAILACDCVFNYALIDPLVQACADICKLRVNPDPNPTDQPTLCIIAQQLRQPDVFEQWLAAFHEHFRVWRMPDDLLTPSLKGGSGFVVHVGILR